MSNKMKAKEIRNMNKFPAIQDEWCFQSNEELYEEHLNTNYPDDEDDYSLSMYDYEPKPKPCDCYNCNPVYYVDSFPDEYYRDNHGESWFD